MENASAIRQVTGNIQQTVERVNHMTGISQDNVSTIEGIHALSDEVADQSVQLKRTIAALVQMAEEQQGAWWHSNSRRAYARIGIQTSAWRFSGAEDDEDSCTFDF